MSDLVVVAFPEEKLAFELRTELVKLQKQYLIDIEDVVVVTRDDAGKVKLHQAVDLVGVGAVGGGFWGMLIGFLFLNPLLGAAIGAGAGALSGLFSDVGINDRFIKELAENFKPGCSAVFILLRKVTGDKVLAEPRVFGARARYCKPRWQRIGKTRYGSFSKSMMRFKRRRKDDGPRPRQMDLCPSVSVPAQVGLLRKEAGWFAMKPTALLMETSP